MSGLHRVLCALRGHRPGPGTAWNHGYHFGHCLRCGRPIMRAVFGHWREPPPGYRIVWPPQRRRERAAPVAAAGSSGWDFMREDAAPQVPAQRSAFDFDDFMADEPAEEPPSPPPAPRRRAS